MELKIYVSSAVVTVPCSFTWYSKSTPKFDEVLNELDSAGKAKLKLRTQNDNAYYDLIACFDDLPNFTIIEQSVTDELPYGDTALAWKNLCAWHEPNTTANMSALLHEFNKTSLSNVKKSLDKWIAQLEVIKLKLAEMNVDIPIDIMIVRIIHNLPKEYDAITD
jgi:gag-polypeptide of LTR copia-type